MAMTPEELPSLQAGPRLGLVRRAVKRWVAQLVDKGARNNLLFYRDLKAGTLDLTPSDGVPDQEAVDALLEGSAVRLSLLFRDVERLSAAAWRARTIRAKAQEMFEERGLVPLHIGIGLATWNTDRTTATPASRSQSGSITGPRIDHKVETWASTKLWRRTRRGRQSSHTSEAQTALSRTPRSATTPPATLASGSAETRERHARTGGSTSNSRSPMPHSTWGRGK